MGLDQYLYAREYLSGTDHKRTASGDYISEENPTFNAVIEAVGLTREETEEDFPSLYVEVKVAQWRKAWAIHTWFVNEVQAGEDDCKDYYVSRGKLIDLRDLCQQVLDNPETMEELLPDPHFGTSDEEWNTYQLTHTIKQLDRVLNNSKFDGWDFEYTSSW